ncbi:hypothetical protein NADE_006411 [Nannochloris sp. 'desiccata']|nr:hypothetical protein NADE_006411 [Chlorella desiccata (nom. nud.)]
MLPRLRASAKKAIGLLERRVSSSKQSLKQQLTLHPVLFSSKPTNETPGFVRNQHKAELPPDAKATPAATPEPSSPDVRLFGAGALGALGAGALLYSLSGNADGGSDDRRKSSKWKVENPFFNRSNEQMEFTDKFNDKPRVINVLVGPPSCGKSRFLEEVVDQLVWGRIRLWSFSSTAAWYGLMGQKRSPRRLSMKLPPKIIY